MFQLEQTLIVVSGFNRSVDFYKTFGFELGKEYHDENEGKYL